MASILDRFGIKEVADVTFYNIDDFGEPTTPVLFLDTLKVSTIEQTAEQSEARGGKGNPPLIVWDYNKEINLTLEDALFSPKSMAIMLGDGTVDTGEAGDGTGIVKKTIAFSGTEIPTTFKGPQGRVFDVPTEVTIYTENGVVVDTGETGDSLVEGERYFATFDMAVKDMGAINVSSDSFPGVYYVVGETFARSQQTGVDELFQFVIPKAKIQSENTITLEAEGDPSVFNLSLRVLRPDDGQMMKLIKYDMEDAAQG